MDNKEEKTTKVQLVTSLISLGLVIYIFVTLFG
jgi:hypothetical protein